MVFMVESLSVLTFFSNESRKSKVSTHFNIKIELLPFEVALELPAEIDKQSQNVGTAWELFGNVFNLCQSLLLSTLNRYVIG